MPQMSLMADHTAWAYSLILRCDPTRPDDGTTVQVTTYNRKSRPLADGSAVFRGIETDFLEDVAKATVQAYLWGNVINDPQRVLMRLHKEAVAHRRAHERKPSQ